MRNYSDKAGWCCLHSFPHLYKHNIFSLSIYFVKLQEWFSTRLKNFSVTKTTQMTHHLTVESPLYDVRGQNTYITRIYLVSHSLEVNWKRFYDPIKMITMVTTDFDSPLCFINYRGKIIYRSMIEDGRPSITVEKSFIGAWLNTVNHQVSWKNHL